MLLKSKNRNATKWASKLQGTYCGTYSPLCSLLEGIRMHVYCLYVKEERFFLYIPLQFFPIYRNPYMPMICRKPWITITCLSTPLTSPIRAQSVIFECNSHNCLSTIALMNLAWLPQAHIYISRSSPNSQWAHIRAHLHEISGLLLPLPKSQSMRAYLLHPDCSHADGTRFVCICTWWHNLIY